MSNNIQFETDTTDQRAYVRRDASGKQTSAMAAWLIKHNIAKSANSAQGLLIAVVVANIVIIYILLTYFL